MMGMKLAQLAPPPALNFNPQDSLKLLNRVTWGANNSAARQVDALGPNPYLEQQLRPPPAVLPPVIQNQITAMTISQRPLDVLVQELEQRRKEADGMSDPDAKKAAQQMYQQELNRLAREAASRFLLRALYSPNQLQEQMTWFWLNHFSLHQGKHNLRAMVADYEERAIRPHALGKFRDLLAATARHPAMLRYLDNEQNAVNRLNENYARELLELHTLGVNGGYSQKDVQEMARILTGVGVNLGTSQPAFQAKSPVQSQVASQIQSPAQFQAQYLRQGLFEFNPNRHDYGSKQLLGKTIPGKGLAELDQALAQLAANPATARFICRKIAQFMVADEPPDALVQDMAQSYLRSDGDIATVLRTMFLSPAFAQSLGQTFKDPLHYVISAVRLAHDDKPILNTGPMLNWLNRMGQPLYGRQTPDGYPMQESAWASPLQMASRFEIAKAIGSGSAALFKADTASLIPPPQLPQLPQSPQSPQSSAASANTPMSNALYFQSLQSRLSPATRQALGQALSPQEWNIFLLSSPEMMYR